MPCVDQVESPRIQKIVVAQIARHERIAALRNGLRDVFAARAAADGCRSFYADSFTPCSVNLSGTQCKWLFRCMGEYFTRECSARAAFDAYESYRKDDPHALLARYAAEEE